MYAKVVFDIALDREFDYIVPEELESAAKPMLRVRAPFGPRVATGIITEITNISDSKYKLKPLAQIIDREVGFSGELAELARFMKKNWGGTLGQILFSLLPFFTKEEEVLHEERTAALTTLSTVQKLAQDDIKAADRPVLLFGEGQSGKKEIIINLALEEAKSRQVLLLVPDITSAEILAKQIEKQTSSQIFIWHSKVLLTGKRKIFSTLLSGAPALVVGTRSACLLPLKNPGLIAVTHEESPDYKQEENRPYYHTRDILLFRAEKLKCKTVFASATPSLEMLERVKEDKVKLVNLPQKKDIPNPFPRINTAGKKSENSLIFSDVLMDEASKAVQNNERVLFVSASKGGLPTYSCLNCGLLAKCQDCGGLLVFNEENAPHLTCIKCGKEAALEQKCPKCSNLIFRQKTSGVQKIVTETKKLFSGANIIRMDKPLPSPLYSLLEGGRANIIIGTAANLKTLITKNMTLDLICFLDADMELNSPDFRASEHLTQLLFSAKGLLFNSKTGRMVVQADKADTTLFNSVIHGDYRAFAQEETDFRETFEFPPYCKLTKITVSSKKMEDVLAAVSHLKNVLANTGQVTGPVATGKKTDALKKQYILIKNANFEDIENKINSIKTDKKIKLKFTADPYVFF